MLGDLELIFCFIDKMEEEFVNTIRDTTDTETLRFFITIFILT